MEAIFIVTISTLFGMGLYLLLRPKMFSVILGICFWGHGANLLILLMGRLRTDAPPILDPYTPGQSYTDPLSQAFILTAIVIGFAMTVLLLVIAFRAGEETQTDHVDGIYHSSKTQEARLV